MEPRQLLAAASISLQPGGILTLIGDEADNNIRIFRHKGSVVGSIGVTTASFTTNSVSAIYVNGFSGDDTISNDTDIPSSLDGGSGLDSIIGGTGVDDILGWNPLAGDFGSDGVDTIDGRAGDDYMIDDGDALDYRTRDEAIRYFGTYENPTEFTRTIRVGEHEIDHVFFRGTILGSRFDDSFIPGDMQGPFDFFGFDGDDYFQAPVSGGAIAEGGKGNDTFWQATLYNGGTDPPGAFQMLSYGGPGDDRVILFQYPGEQSWGFYDLGEGTDTVDLREYARGVDLPAVEPRYFFVIDGQSVERVENIGQTGSMLVQDGRLNGTGGLYFGASSEAAGPVTLIGGASNDTLVGSSFSDQLVGGAGNDTLHGNAGDDLLISRDGQADQLFGGEGIDRAYADPAGKGGDMRDRVEVSLIKTVRVAVENPPAFASVRSDVLAVERGAVTSGGKERILS